MTSIYSFLQKRKMHENQHGIAMVIIAYVLSILMLALGSDIFYNINSEAAGAQTETIEETQDLDRNDISEVLTADETNDQQQSGLINPYSLTEVSAAGSGASFPENATENSDTIWFLGNAMDTETFDSLMVRMGDIIPDKNVSQMAAEAADTAEKTDLSAISSNTDMTQDKETSKDTAKDETAKEETAKEETAKEETAKQNEDDGVIESFSVEVGAKNKEITVSQDEVKMLERIVEAEASGEDIVGKILVANVIFNRIVSGEFPDSVEEVIFQHEHGDYQFSPVESGRYYDVKVSKETRKAVQRALEGEDYSKGALYFIAKKHTDSDGVRWFDKNLDWLFKHGGHDFYK